MNGRKIALISSHGGLNGAAKVVESLVRGLASHGASVRLYHRPGAWLASIDLDRVAELRPLDMGVRRLNPSTVRRLPDELADWGAIVLHSHGTTADRLSAALGSRHPFGRVATAHARVLHPHWRFHDCVIAPSEYTARWYRRWRLVRSDRLHLVTTGVPDPLAAGRQSAPPVETRAALGLRPDEFVLTMVGDLCRRKNQSSAIDLLAALVARGLGVRLVIVGAKDGVETPDLIERARAAGVLDRVLLTGPRADVPDILAASDCFLSVSRDEQGPLALVEAMALSLPVVSTPVGWGADVVAAGPCGMNVPQRNPSLAAPFVERLARDRVERARVGAAGRAIYETQFGMEAFIRSTVGLYDSLIAARAPAPPGAAAAGRSGPPPAA